MRFGSLFGVLAAFALTGCPGGDAGIGAHCNTHGDCSSELQCQANTCVPRCVRAPECGDGFRCSESGICAPATGQPGDSCQSETDCAAGLACQIEPTATAATGNLVASCVTENAGRPAGAECATDGDCRNGTCELGHCIDLCAVTRDCGTGTSCTQIPRVAADGHMFGGCLQDTGSLSWTIPLASPTTQGVALPIPERARSVSVYFTVEDLNQKVGATELTSPSGLPLISSNNAYYLNQFVRHRPEFGQSVLAIPSTSYYSLESGVYRATVKSLRLRIDPDTGAPSDAFGTATPTMTAVINVGSAASKVLDLHFYFLNLDDHPCAAKLGGMIDASSAEQSSIFKEQFVDTLASIFAPAVSIGTVTYEDLRDHPDLDGLDVDNAAALLALGAHATGINVFFVRTLSPVGLQAFGPNPGPAGLAGTRQSGIVIGLDTLCYRSWGQLARLTAHELARYMGLYRNVEQDPLQPLVLHVDPIADSDSDPTTGTSNLMFYSELGGTELSLGQAEILGRSAVLH